MDADSKAGCRPLSCMQSLGRPDEPACEVVVEKSPSPWNVVVSGQGKDGSDGVLVENAEIVVPSAIHVSSPNGQQQYEGTYWIVANSTPNGLPVWRKRGEGHQSEKWLYSSVHGTWNFGGDKARRQFFNCHSARIFCLQRHGGLMPHQMARWWRAEESSFVEDSSISVSEAPASAEWFLDDSSGSGEATAPISTISSRSTGSCLKRDLNEVGKEEASSKKADTKKSSTGSSPKKAISVRLQKRPSSGSERKGEDPESVDRARGQ